MAETSLMNDQVSFDDPGFRLRVYVALALYVTPLRKGPLIIL